MEAADILGALQARVALVPGCRDLEERPLLLVPVPVENAPWTKERLDLVLRYFASIYSGETRRAGLSVVVDARGGSWRCARVAMRQVGASLGPDLASLLVIRPDAFWDKQRVDSCARAQRQGEPVLIPLSRLCKYVAPAQTPEELGGLWVHNHHQWIQNRIYMETFAREAETAANDLDKLRGRLAGQQAMLSGESAATTNPTTIGAITISARINLEQPPVTVEAYHQTKESARQVVAAGRELLERLDGDYSCVDRPVPQDVVDTRTRIERLLELLAAKQALLNEAWHSLQNTFVDAKELAALEERVSQVTDWILGPAETMLNVQREVGLDVASAEELREAHESLELQCRETYGQYAELLHRLDSRPAAGLPLPADLRSQRDFMDFACRSFATRLERRRNVLITSLRFYRLVDEYLESTADILEALMRDGDLEALDSVDDALRQLQAHQVDVEELERLVVRQGEKLSDLLSMPVKDALGREVNVDYDAHIGHVTALLEAVKARQALFLDTVTLRRLTLQQAGHIRAYEQDAAQAVRWLQELFRVLVSSHAHVGCTAQEIQTQKAEQQGLQETARAAHQYGSQLLSAARSLRLGQSPGASPGAVPSPTPAPPSAPASPTASHQALTDQLQAAWDALHSVSQEQMTRLRVSAVFHRSVNEHCKQLRELAAAVPALAAEPDESRRRGRLRKFLANRERLLLEVGRMVRLGRLLRSRLREPLQHQQQLARNQADTVNANTTAIEAISERLAEVTALAEQLDRALTAAHLDPSAPPPPPSVEDVTDAPSVQEDPEHELESEPVPELGLLPLPLPQESADEDPEWRSPGGAQQQAEPQQAAALRQVLDESEDFISASECTCTPPSRSSSFHTASEGGVTSPWWELDPTSEEGDEAEVLKSRVSGTPSKASKQVQTVPSELNAAMTAPAAAAVMAVEAAEKPQEHQQEQEGLDEEREVLCGVVTQRQVTETRQMVVRRGGGETRAASELSCSRLEVSHLNGCNASTSSAESGASTLSSGTRGALESVMLLPSLPLDEDPSSAAYQQQLEDSLPLDLPSPLAFADPIDLTDDGILDQDDMPPPPQELLDGLKEVRDENANHVVLLDPDRLDLDLDRLDLDTGSGSSRFLCPPHILRHAIKGIF